SASSAPAAAVVADRAAANGDLLAATAETATGDRLGAVLQAIARRRQVLAAHLAEAQSLRLEGDELHIYQPPGDPWLAAALERAGNRSALEEALAEVCGPGLRWRVLVAETAPLPPAASPSPALAADPTVQAVLDIFDGTIQTVERRAAED
ncbi:MAG TPA: hypothetical protein VGV61_18840, partial [Thermoanaerobaculia bacterium]|nr:hypothetical protein [Thermoanaerobaculia bacterium]